MADLIDGESIAARLRARVKCEATELAARGTPPGLAVVLVGEDPASQVYVRSKLRRTVEAGMTSFEHRLPTSASQDDLLQLIARLNADDRVDGILVQLPLPGHIDSDLVLDAIDPLKDVDGFHPVNVGRLSAGTGGLIPCTPLGCMMLLDTVIDDFRGLKAVVIGKSNIVGKPVAMLLLERECTVTVTHIATRNLPEIVRGADILVVAAGHAGLVRGDWVKPGAVVIDVGINRIVDGEKRRIVGDVAFDEMDHAGSVTPVPGGVGPMTIACLLENTVRAARRRRAEPMVAGDEAVHAGSA
ncbi:bifunctional methylenetetrahydrofolate dehydrogenase/methenyltetrahydrofolate cyclohydrolase FolD [Croceicoccus bisphenolivorans]|uniref:bifunctional methylenetetrahydrofolate dehydrogenase/methenyltetrahydrofolate cyclohydrolase FolD n=1 Tax=Croceicoccus bisphenolivorans TaxID=1783232 RepID=UPI000831EF9C|nr:bifunctional methylenetetrahydrofolate dehydrogenase/methenyltetrahydrofolate cyclohydrolase FolD [Croceicoccus bisphenolivorans]